MNKLKVIIFRYFVFCAFGVSVVCSAVDSLFSDILWHKYAYNEMAMKFILFFHLLCLFVPFFLGAYIFYKFTKKALEKESKRQVEEQNLLYSCIAHDLKTPMTSIQGFACALKDGKVKPEEQGEILDIIYKKSRHMNDLIETLSVYSKLGTQSHVLDKKKTNLCALIRELVAVHYPEFEERQMEPEIEIPEEPIFVELDEREFCRAINNLLINAYKHNQKGTDILIKVCQEKGKAILTVADKGEKIKKELKERMFQPFVCGDVSRNSGNGSGLGLAISVAIVEKHGGKLYLKEKIDGYTKGFVIEMGCNK